MFVSLTRAKTTNEPIENAAIVAEEMTRWLRDIEGFDGFMMLAREGTAVGLSFWESREVAERHRPARREFIDRMTSVAGVEVEEIEEFEVAFAELGPRLVTHST
jgi:heme-degrading monooxygenase HmoA